MSVRNIIDSIKNSQVYCLVYGGKICGFRIAIYNPDAGSMEYYDFSLKAVADDAQTRDYINSNQQKFNRIELQATSDGVLLSADEIAGNIVVKEIKSKEFAVGLVAKIAKIREQIERG